MVPPEYCGGCSGITQADAENLIRRTVKETLTSLGVDTSNPLEMQRDFQALREWRLLRSAIQSKGLMTIIGLLAGGLLTIIVMGVKHAITKGG